MQRSKFRPIAIAIGLASILLPLVPAISQEDLAKRMEDAIALMRSSGQAAPSTLVPMLTSCAEGYIQNGDFDTALKRVQEALILSRENDIDPTYTFTTASKILNRADDELATQFLLTELQAPNGTATYKKGVLKALDLHLAVNGNQKLALKASLELWKIVHAENPGSEEEFWALFKFGNHCLTGKLYEDAGKALKDARAMALKLNKPDLAANCSRSLGYALSAGGNYEEALKLFEEAIRFTRASPQKTMLGFELQNIASTYIQLNEWDKAIAALKEAESLSRNEYEKGLLQAMFSGLAFKQALVTNPAQPDLSHAIAFQEKAVAAKLQNDSAGKEFALLGATPDYITLASYQILGGKLDDAEVSLQQATRGADAWEANSRNAQKSAVFSADQVNLSMAMIRSGIFEFQQQIDALRGNAAAALVTTENGRGTAQAELLKEKMGLPASDRVSKDLDEQAIIEIAKSHNSTLVVYSIVHTISPDSRRYFNPKDRWQHPQYLYTWVVTPQGEISFKQTALKGPLVNLIQLARSEITNPPEKVPPVPARKTLSDLLIAPISDQLPQEEGALVTFIPQGQLFLVPFSALPLQDGRDLIDQYTIGMSPSIELLKLAKTQKEAVIAADLKDILLVGNPTMPGYQSRPDRDAHKLSPLPGAEAEAKYLGGILKTEPLIGDAATEVAVASKMEAARILHFATHGLLESESSYNEAFLSALAFAPGEGEDGFLTVKETARMKLRAELAVLSACDTGRGQISGDGVIGLSRGYITAGVPTVVVSLWPVSDQATAVLMGHFYESLTSGSPKSVALRSAILETKKKYPAPGMWAPFVLYGLAQ